MATKLPNLSLAKRFNLKMLNRHYRLLQKAGILIIGMLALCGVEEYSVLAARLNSSLSFELLYWSKSAEMLELANFGAPGWVHGTSDELDKDIELNTERGM